MCPGCNADPALVGTEVQAFLTERGLAGLYMAGAAAQPRATAEGRGGLELDTVVALN
jgi:hypothetical protein